MPKLSFRSFLIGIVSHEQYYDLEAFAENDFNKLFKILTNVKIFTENFQSNSAFSEDKIGIFIPNFG